MNNKYKRSLSLVVMNFLKKHIIMIEKQFHNHQIRNNNIKDK